MKNMKKLFSLVLALVMVMGLTVAAGAASAGTNNDTGSITIDNAIPGQDYSAYQLLVLESYNNESKSFAYKVNPSWSGFFATVEAKTYVSINDQGYVSWVEGADAAAFAKAALAYAKGTGETPTIAANETKTADSNTVAFSGLNLGYYLIDSSAGALCSLDTTNPSVTIIEKNTVPEVKKDQTVPAQVKIGDTVNYLITITVPAGAQAYQLVDTMGDGLTYNKDLAITLVSADTVVTKDTVTSAIDTIYTGASAAYTTGSDNSFPVSFGQEFLDAIAGNYKIVVKYTATINSNAGVVSENGTVSETLDNKAVLHYGDNKTVDTESGHTQISIFKFPVTKVTSENKMLGGAEFELYASNATDATPIPMIYDAKLSAYRAATADEQKVEGFKSATIVSSADAFVEIYGFGAGTYYLKETKAPNGYNKLADLVTINLTDMNLTGSVTATTTEETDSDGNTTTVTTYSYTGTAAKIVNYTGTEMPSTGGIGTTIFTVVGGLLMVGAAILFLTKKRSEV